MGKITAVVLILIATAVIGCAAGNTHEANRDRPADDNLVVPDWRIGPIWLGMDEKELLKRYGAPDKIEYNVDTNTGQRVESTPTWRSYYWPNLVVTVERGAVYHITSANTNARTSDGLVAGMPVGEAYVKKGPPVSGDSSHLCYPGLLVGVRQARVYNFTVRKSRHTC